MQKGHPLRKLFEELSNSGWTVIKTKKHIKMIHKEYGLVTCSSTPSCPYVEQHVRSDIKRKMRGHYDTK